MITVKEEKPLKISGKLDDNDELKVQEHYGNRCNRCNIHKNSVNFTGFAPVFFDKIDKKTVPILYCKECWNAY